MDAGLDTGDLLLTHSLDIADTDTASLHDRLAAPGGVVAGAATSRPGTRQPVVQPTEGITYAHKIEKAESNIDWSLPAAAIGQRIRAFDPFGASATLGREVIKLSEPMKLMAVSADLKGCGHILSINDAGITVTCGDNTALRLTVLQRAGGKRRPPPPIFCAALSWHRATCWALDC